MGSFLLKEDELHDEQDSLAVNISSFVHTDRDGKHYDRIKIIAICSTLLTTFVMAVWIIFGSSSGTDKVMIIPENTSLKEAVEVVKEKHEDKEIYNYLNEIDADVPTHKHKIIHEEFVSDNNKEIVLHSGLQRNESNEGNKETAAGASDYQLTPNESQSLKKIDDLIKSVIGNFHEQEIVDETASNDVKLATENEIHATQDIEKFKYNKEDVAKFIESSNGFYRIKLGTFEKHSEARDLIKKFYDSNAEDEKMANVPYYILAIDDEVGSVSYKVLVGDFKTMDDAVTFAVEKLLSKKASTKNYADTI